MHMIALEEKITILPTLFVEKRDGRRVVFDVDKIDKALHKAADKVMDVTPLVEKRLNALTERIVTEIHSRFPQGVKIYEIQNKEKIQNPNHRMHILSLTFEDFDQGIGNKPSCYPVSDRIGKSHKNRSKESWNGFCHIIPMDIF